MLDYALLRVLGIVTLLQLWWIAIWGVSYIGIEYITKHTLLTEFWIYLSCLLTIYFVLFTNPELVKHLL